MEAKPALLKLNAYSKWQPKDASIRLRRQLISSTRRSGSILFFDVGAVLFSHLFKLYGFGTDDWGRWYNTTYIMFAVTNLLLPLSRKSLSFLAPMETTLLIDGVNKSIEILEAMDESVVAQESVEIVKNHLRDYVADINHDPTHLNRNNNALDSMSQEPGHVDVQAGANHAADTFHHDTLNDPVGMLNLNDMSFDEFLPVRSITPVYPFYHRN